MVITTDYCGNIAFQSAFQPGISKGFPSIILPWPCPGQLPPFFLPGESCQTFGIFSVVGQGGPTIVVAVFENVARVYGTHQKGIRRHVQRPISSNISHAQASCPLFSFLESLAKLLAYFLLWEKESQPLLWQCLRMLLGSMEHTRKASGVRWSHQSHQTSAMPRPVAPFFPFLENLAKLLAYYLL